MRDVTCTIPQNAAGTAATWEGSARVESQSSPGAGLLIALLSILLGGGAAAAAVSAVAAAKGPNDSQSVITGPKNVVAPSQVIGYGG